MHTTIEFFNKKSSKIAGGGFSTSDSWIRSVLLPAVTLNNTRQKSVKLTTLALNYW